MERFVGKVAVVTGSSAGIGESISKELLKRAVNVVGLSRNVYKLQEMEKEVKNDSKTYLGKFYSRKCDVRNVQDIKDSFDWIKNDIGPVSILINNAGILLTEPTFEMSEETFDITFETNVKGLVMCAKEAIKSMFENNIEGHILNINSIAGHTMVDIEDNPYMIYTASKHAARVFSEALRRDMRSKKANVKITNVCPGLVLTNMTKKFFPDYEFNPNEALLPKDVADACISVIDTAPHVLISELTINPIHCLR